jgi:hypothetical protein
MRGKITKMRGYSALIHLIIAETNAKIASTVIKFDRMLCSLPLNQSHRETCF